MQEHEPATLIRTDATGFSENQESALLVLEISRREIESCNVPSSLERLLVMSDSRETTLRYRESLVFQVTGYDNDRRELPEIPEVRTFFAKLTVEWPHWFWFLHRDVGAIPLLLSLLCNVKIHRGSNNSFGTEFVDPQELKDRLDDMLSRGKALFAAFAIDEEEASSSIVSAWEEIYGN